MLRELGTLRREIKSRLIKKGYDNVRMVDPLEVNGAASSVAAAKAIMRDQVHMHSIGYAICKAGRGYQGVGSLLVTGQEAEGLWGGSSRAQKDKA